MKRTIRMINQDRSDRDASGAPAKTDWIIYDNLVTETFMSDPPLSRILAPKVRPLAYDGRFVHEDYIMGDMKEAQVAAEAGVADDEIEGTPVQVNVCTIFKTATMSDESWNQLFVNQDRQPIIESGITRKIAEKEEEIAFRGNTKMGITGLVGGATAVTPTATTLGYEGNSDGVLTNFRDLVKKFITTLSDSNCHIGGDRGGVPLDLAMTWPIFDLLNDTFLDDDPKTNNLTLIENMLGGGRVYGSNWLQASVTSVANTILGLPRLPPVKAPWYLLASQLDSRPFQNSIWSRQLGAREKFSVKIKNATFILKATSLSMNAS